ncbi:protein FAM189A1-like [Zingiber officinale]|uniref:protein FAM189A1-like n=1 Tax=Zingiber officinale TaxID=94328 RepID=UPI001C4D5A95|nr:protein FAM189A1-like [Zingiber officinale]
MVEPTQWCSDIPSNLSVHQHHPSCDTASEKLQRVSVRSSILLLEGFLYSFGLSPVQAEIGAPLEAAMLRAYSSDIKRQSFAVLKAISPELKQGLAASSRSTPSASQPVPSTSQSAPPAPAQEEAPSALPLDVAVEDPATLGQVEEERAASPPPAKRLRLQRKRKKVTPATQESPPPLPSGWRSSTASQSSAAKAVTLDWEIDLGPEVPTLSLRISTPTPGRAVTPEQASFPTQAFSLGQLPLQVTNQPGSSPTLSTSLPAIASASTSRSRGKIHKKYAFTDSWRLPSSTEPDAAEETTEEAPPPVVLVKLQGNLAAS